MTDSNQGEFPIPTESELPNPLETMEIDQTIKENVTTRKAGEEAIDFLQEGVKTILDVIKEEDKDFVTKRFWEMIRDAAIKEIGRDSTDELGIKPMVDEEAALFVKKEMPFGKFVGKTVGYVLKKDKEALLKFAYSPHWFQSKLARFLAREENK